MHAIEQTYVSLLADVSSLTGYSEIRGSYEGLHWCLHEAPQLEKYMLGCLEEGRNPDLDRFPAWLRRLVVGSLLDPIKLRYLRQLLLFSYKAYVEHDITTTEKTIKSFLQTNTSVGEIGNRLSSQSPYLLNETRRICQAVLYRANWKEIIPSHGPGAVTNSKEIWKSHFSTIETCYPYSDYMFLNQEHMSSLDNVPYTEHIEAKLIAVPKDSRGPRLICVHPAEAIWIQQGLRRVLERAITRHRRLDQGGPWPHGHIFFDNQAVNGRIALLSSRSRRYATLDMKDASDRISEPLVQHLFGDAYKWFGCCRAQKCLVPRLGHMANIRTDIHSYAPMGNATTFPVQSLVFWAICSAALQFHGFHQPGAVFVFGDDIIVPSECAELIIDALESFGLLVNRTKSFWRGAFRESCGTDAFNGVNVTPVRWKTSLDADHLVGLQSLSDLGQRLRCSGYEEAASCVYGILRTRLKRRGLDLFFTNNPNHGGLAEYSKSSYLAFRDAYWHRDVQWFTSPVYRVESPQTRSGCSGWNHVLDSITSLERKPQSSMDRSSVRLGLFSRRARLNRGWIPVL